MEIAKGMLLAFALVLLVAASGCASVAGSQSAPWTYAWGSTGWGWEGLVGVALATMFTVLALAYMASTLLGDEQMRAWVKREIGQLAYSALIIVVAVVMMQTLDAWLQLMAGSAGSPPWNTYVNNVICCRPTTGNWQADCPLTPPFARASPCHLSIAKDYLQVLFESARTQANYNLMNYWWTGFLSNWTVVVKLPALIDIGHAQVKPLGWLSINLEMYSVLLDLLFKTMMFLRMQQIFMDYLYFGFFPLMLAMGLVLRVFHFSRKLGGMLVALGLALYVVLPMYYVLMDAILFSFMGGWVGGLPGTFGNSLNQSQIITPGVNSSVNLSGQEGSATFAQPVNMGNICGNSTAEEKTEMGNMVDMLKTQLTAAENSDFLGPAKDKMTDRFGPDGPIANLAMLLVFTLVSPFVGLMLTLSAFKVLSPMIGGDVEISLLSRLI